MRTTRKSHKLLAAWLLCATQLYCHLVLAEEADRNKPIHIESDQLSVDQANQVSSFDGHVQFIQGTILMLADRVVVKQDKDGYKHCTATGHVASFRQKSEGSNEFVEGFGERIEYDTRAETIDFFEQAQVKRGQDDLRGKHITYNTRTEIVSVSGNPTADPDAPGQGRVRAVIQPKNDETIQQPRQNKSESLSIKPSTKLIESPRP
jgi:lipopolysaccharide export system protein LptA